MTPAEALLAAAKGVLDDGSWHDDGTFVYTPPTSDDADEGAVGDLSDAVAAVEAMARVKPPVRSAEEILKSLVADIEAMRAEHMDDRLDEESPDRGCKAFGGFDVMLDRTYMNIGHFISWPNLAILLDEAKAFLAR